LKRRGLGRIEPEDKALLANARERRREGYGRGEMGVKDIRVAIENAHLKTCERDGVSAGLVRVEHDGDLGGLCNAVSAERSSQRL
jgi:hypothetical protein